MPTRSPNSQLAERYEAAPRLQLIQHWTESTHASWQDSDEWCMRASAASSLATFTLRANSTKSMRNAARPARKVSGYTSRSWGKPQLGQAVKDQGQDRSTIAASACGRIEALLPPKHARDGAGCAAVGRAAPPLPAVRPPGARGGVRGGAAQLHDQPGEAQQGPAPAAHGIPGGGSFWVLGAVHPMLGTELRLVARTA